MFYDRLEDFFIQKSSLKISKNCHIEASQGIVRKNAGF